MRAMWWAVLSILLATTPTFADPPARPFHSFDEAKAVARDAIYGDQHVDFYCGCDFVPTGRSGGTIDAARCGYQARADPDRGRRLEWEHVVPAYFFGRDRACWRDGDPQCFTANGAPYKGRRCCVKPGVDSEFRRIEADLHNLVPVVGELNGDRSNLPYGTVDGETRRYGACDFEIGDNPRVAEPTDSIRGDAARVWLYMAETYGVEIEGPVRAMFESWSGADPVDDWERLRDDRICAAQGNRNQFVNGDICPQ